MRPEDHKAWKRLNGIMCMGCFTSFLFGMSVANAMYLKTEPIRRFGNIAVLVLFGLIMLGVYFYMTPKAPGNDK